MESRREIKGRSRGGRWTDEPPLLILAYAIAVYSVAQMEARP